MIAASVGLRGTNRLKALFSVESCIISNLFRDAESDLALGFIFKKLFVDTHLYLRLAQKAVCKESILSPFLRHRSRRQIQPTTEILVNPLEGIFRRSSLRCLNAAASFTSSCGFFMINLLFSIDFTMSVYCWIDKHYNNTDFLQFIHGGRALICLGKTP